jgi:hypothetical protein
VLLVTLLGLVPGSGCSSHDAHPASTLRAPAQPPPARASQALSLGGTWAVWLDRDATGLEAGWVASLTAGEPPPGVPNEPLALAVPGPLEASEATRDHDGAAFYVRRFDAPSDVADARTSLHFERVDYACRVWLDGRLLGEHEGDLDAFAFDCTGLLRPGASHVLVVLVIDPGTEPVYGLRLKATPHAKQSWYENFGGLLGPVVLRVEHGWSLLDARITVDSEEETVSVSASLAPPVASGKPTTLTATVHALDADGSPLQEVARHEVPLPPSTDDPLPVLANLTVPDARRWSPQAPALYRVALELDGRVLTRQQVGFRSIALEDGDLLLDGRPLRLAGVLWQPHFTGTGGMLPDVETLERTVRAMKDTGFDLVRAHVRPAPDAFLDACDRLGLLVLEEPGIGWVDDDPELPGRMLRELDRMVARHAHHPSLIAWGVLNELSGRAYRHADVLTAHLARLDPTRPVLEDSGAFFGAGRVVPPGGGAPLTMVDRHSYPPYPLPIEERETLRRLVDPAGGPVFVSEFGHGTLLDTVAAVEPFRSRGTVTAERVMYESWAALARRARASGEAWTDGDWVGPAAELQADAAEDMIEALRSNPAVDLFCYTQWQAVSQEASAGVLGPWGADRPVRARIRRALRPLAVLVFPERPSVTPGEEVACAIHVANRTGRTVDGALVLEWGGERRTVGNGPWPPGVRGVTAALPAVETAGTRVLEVALVGPDGDVLDRATPRTLAVAPGPSPIALTAGADSGAIADANAGTVAGPIAVWAPPDEPSTRAFLRRWGLEPATSPTARPLLALIGDPERLRERLGDEDWLALWHGVRVGGAAIVLAPDPTHDAIGERFGTARGVRTLASLPEPFTTAAAAGNFMARVHVMRDGDAPRLLGRGDEVLSPTTMLVSELPEGAVEHTITLGWLGNRVGAPDAGVPLGRGALHLIGMPLLDALDGRVEPRRDARLAARLEAVAQDLVEAIRSGAEAGEAYGAPPPAVREAFFLDWGRIGRALALADRVSPFSGGRADRDALLGGALEARSAALVDLLEGRGREALERIGPAAEAVWPAHADAFLEAEARVLERLGERVTAAGREDWDRAYDALSSWVTAVTAYQAGRAGEAFEALDQARARLGDA